MLIINPILNFSQINTFDSMTQQNKMGNILIGKTDFQTVLALPEFTQISNPYSFNDDAIRQLSNKLYDYSIVCFIGTWCEDSHVLIPIFFEVLQKCHYPIDKVLLYAVDRDKKTTNGAEAPYNITFVPTIIILKDEMEKGRIVEQPQLSLEEDLLKLID